MSNHKIQNFIVKGKEVFVGLEDSKKSWKIAVRSGRMLIHETAMEAKYNILIGYLRNKFPQCNIHLVYEAGFKGFNLHDQLTEDGISCVVIPPHIVTEPKVNKVKTDKRDAKRLALILENHDFKFGCYVPDKERREDRQVSRTLGAIKKDITRNRGRIRMFLYCHGIETAFANKDKWGRAEFLALKDLSLSGPLKISLNTLVVMLEQLWNYQKELRAYLRELCRKERYRKAYEIAKSMPGIGWYTAIRLVLELGENLSRFTNGKQIAGFVGLGCGEHSTGETERKGHITGMGSGFIRSTLIENSWAAIRKDPVLLDKFNRVRGNNKSKKKAIVAVARMLIVRFRACVMSGKPYVIGVVR
jgi:transposase